MKRLALLSALALAACSSGSQRTDYRGVKLRPAANPSAVIAAELAFAQLAQDKGQWAAFRETAADEAEMFVPQRVKAQDWLKGKAEPATALKWQPYEVWSSCDGSYAITRGGWTGPRGAGHFNTVWQRQNNSRHKWVLDIGDDAQAASSPPEMIAARVAVCPQKDAPLAAPAAAPFEAGADSKTGYSSDRTLSWTSEVRPGDTHRLTVRMWDGSEYDTVIDTGVAPHGH